MQDYLTLSEYFISKKGWGKNYQHSNFLDDLNNQLDVPNPVYKERISSLNYFGAYHFADDVQFNPRTSQWFSTKTTKREIPLRYQPMYRDDLLGMRQMHKEGRMLFYSNVGDHMHVHEYQMKRYLAPLLLGTTPFPNEYSYSDLFGSPQR